MSRVLPTLRNISLAKAKNTQPNFVTVQSLSIKMCRLRIKPWYYHRRYKFEFGLDENGNMVIGDEMLTPDSSRFWPVEGYEPGHGQPSFDKQFARDWLTSHPDNDWTLPDDVVQKTIDKYLQCYKMITGEELA